MKIIFVSGKIFYASNGITISADRQTVYVNDPTDLRIAVMNRDPATGHLRHLTLSFFN
jgi:sugar lactone lactonase YvrE